MSTTNESITVLHPSDEEIRIEDRFDGLGPLIIISHDGVEGRLPVDMFLAMTDVTKNPVFLNPLYRKPEPELAWYTVTDPGRTIDLGRGDMVSRLRLKYVKSHDGSVEPSNVPWNVSVCIHCDRYRVWDIAGQPVRRGILALAISFIGNGSAVPPRKVLSHLTCRELIETINVFNELYAMQHDPHTDRNADTHNDNATLAHG